MAFLGGLPHGHNSQSVSGRVVRAMLEVRGGGSIGDRNRWCPCVVIRERGFEIIPFEDHVAFRFAYESKYRALWDKGERSDEPQDANRLHPASAIELA